MNFRFLDDLTEHDIMGWNLQLTEGRHSDMI